jgi:hypothetical protein
VRLSPLGMSATNWTIVPARLIDDYGLFSGMRIGRGSRSTLRKPAPLPLYLPQIPQDLIWDRTLAVALESRLQIA